MTQEKKLKEVAMPIKEISKESVGDESNQALVYQYTPLELKISNFFD